MKKTLLSLVFCLFLLCLQAQAHAKILLLTDDRPPFEFVNAKGQADGIAVNKVKSVLDAMKEPYEIQVMPWKRAQSLVEQGQADAFFSGVKSADRDKYAVLSNPIVEQYWDWYLLKTSKLNPNDPSFKTTASATSWLGSNSQQWLEKQGYKTTSAPNDMEQLLMSLKTKRVDAIYGSNFAIEEELKKGAILKMSDVKVVKGLYTPMGVYFSKKFVAEHPGFMEKFNATIKKLNK